MLQASFSGDTNTMSEILKYVHDMESPIFTYDSETKLSSAVSLVYLAQEMNIELNVRIKRAKDMWILFFILSVKVQTH